MIGGGQHIADKREIRGKADPDPAPKKSPKRTNIKAVELKDNPSSANPISAAAGAASLTRGMPAISRKPTVRMSTAAAALAIIK